MMRSRSVWCVGAAAAGGLIGTLAARGQEAMYTPAATMPSPGVIIVRPQLNFYQYGSDPHGEIDSTQRIESLTSVQIGLARALSFTVEVPVEFERRSARGTGAVDHDYGVEDIDLMFKYRFLKEDLGGIDTVRAAFMAGAKVASGDDADFSSESFDPHIGAVLTMVRGRHGVNLAADYRLNFGGDDGHAIGGGGWGERCAVAQRFVPVSNLPRSSCRSMFEAHNGHPIPFTHNVAVGAVMGEVLLVEAISACDTW